MTTLAIALLNAQREIRGVGKDGKNSFQNYDYVTAEAIVAVSRSALNAHGLTVDREFTIIDPQAIEPQCPIVYSIFCVRHGETGVELIRTTHWFIVEGKGRPVDKALAGALTSSLAYFLRDLLLIPKQEEAESLDRRDDREAVNRKPADTTLGFQGALKLRKTLTGASLDLSLLTKAMQTKGILPPDDLAEWKTEWLPRIALWIKSNKMDTTEPPAVKV